MAGRPVFDFLQGIDVSLFHRFQSDTWAQPASFTIGHSFIHSVIYSHWLYRPLLCPGLFFSFAILFTQTVGLLGQVFTIGTGDEAAGA
jgi:hypothetical protein